MANDRDSKPSIYSIAAAAQTSVGTVSNVINHPERVRLALRMRVESVMAEQQFRPNATARALSLGRSSLLGAVFFDISNPFFAESAHHLDRLVQARGSSVIVSGTEQVARVESQTLASLGRLGVDGLVVCSTGECWDELADLQNRGVPVLLMAQRSQDDRFKAVHIDDYEGMRLIAALLTDQGMTRFCFLNESIQAIQHRDRWAGFSAGIAEKGFDPESVPVEWCTVPTWDGGYQAASRVLTQPRESWPECFVCLNDYIAIGACKAITDAGLTVGIDISVTGFDDIPYASVVARPLTTVRQPIRQIAEHVTNQLLGAIERGDTDVLGKTFQPTLVQRDSA